MKHAFFTLIVTLFVITFADAQKVTDIADNWRLESWSIAVEMDLNKDGKSSQNLITETSCDNNELLKVNANNTLQSSKTFNPTVNVSKQDDDYKISVKCNKGSIGFSNAFERSGNILNLDVGGSYRLENGKLKRTFQNAIKVFNADFSQVIETKDLVLIYSRQ